MGGPYTDKDIWGRVSGPSIFITSVFLVQAHVIFKRLTPPVFEAPRSSVHISTWGLGQCPMPVGFSPHSCWLCPPITRVQREVGTQASSAHGTHHPSSLQAQENLFLCHGHTTQELEGITSWGQVQSCWTWCGAWEPSATPVFIQPDPHCLGLELPQPVPKVLECPAWYNHRHLFSGLLVGVLRVWPLLPSFQCAQKSIPRYSSIQP